LDAAAESDGWYPIALSVPHRKIKGNLLPSQEDGFISTPLRHEFFNPQSKINNQQYSCRMYASCTTLLH
jgi:hypothetical protein